MTFKPLFAKPESMVHKDLRSLQQHLLSQGSSADNIFMSSFSLKSLRRVLRNLSPPTFSLFLFLHSYSRFHCLCLSVLFLSFSFLLSCRSLFFFKQRAGSLELAKEIFLSPLSHLHEFYLHFFSK